MKKILLIIFCSLLIAHCGALTGKKAILETPYSLSSSSEEKMENNKWRISISGKRFTSNEKIIGFFDKKSKTLCGMSGEYEILEQNIKVLKLNINTIPETFNLNIYGIIQCK